MAETRLTNIITASVAEYLSRYLTEQSVYKSAFYRSGILTRTPELDSFLDGMGRTFNIPYWDMLSEGNVRVPAEDSDITVDPLTSNKMVAVRQIQEKAWGANAISNIFAGEDPMGGLVGKLEEWWNRRLQKYAVSSVVGVINNNVTDDASDLVHDVSAASTPFTDDNLVNSDNVIDAYSLLGDASDFSAIAMHSKPYYRLVKRNLIDFRPDNEQNIGFGVYLGMSVIVDDHLRADAVTGGFRYWTVLFKRGAMGYGESARGITPLEVYRNPKAGGGIDELYTRKQFLMHPQGFAWQDPGAGTIAVAPSLANIETAAYWDRVYNLKNVGFVVMKTNG